jgi:hypothetical protein
MLPGCGKPEPENVPEYVVPIIESILQAFNVNDYSAYSARFDDELKVAISEMVYEGTRDFIYQRIGAYESGKVASLEVEGIYTNVTYKARFSEDSKVTVGITFWDRDGEIAVSRLWFDSPKLRGQ